MCDIAEAFQEHLKDKKGKKHHKHHKHRHNHGCGPNEVYEN